MFEMLEITLIDEKDGRCIRNLYYQQKTKVPLEMNETKNVPIERGVRKGCILSAMLFNIFSEQIFERATAESNEGIRVNGK